MSKVIVVDTCAEISEEMAKKSIIKKVPFYIDIDNQYFLADDNVDIDKLILDMKESKTGVKTAAPSPESFYEAAKGYDEVYIVTISSKLSSSYNSAMIAKDMLKDEYDEVKVKVFDSKSASCGETLVVESIQKYLEENLSFDEICQKVEKNISEINTVFTLEDIGNLVKNGRVSKFKGLLASAFSIYPVSIGVDGEINVKYNVRGLKSAIKKTIDTLGELTNNFNQKTLYVTHVKNEERAKLFVDMAMEKYNFKDFKIFESTALSTIYANKNGIIMAF